MSLATRMPDFGSRSMAHGNGFHEILDLLGIAEGGVFVRGGVGPTLLGAELYGINVNGVAPHAIETEMSAEWPPEKRKAIIEAIPLKRLGRPEDIAEAVLFLASDKAAFITGEILDVNGGFIMD